MLPSEGLEHPLEQATLHVLTIYINWDRGRTSSWLRSIAVLLFWAKGSPDLDTCSQSCRKTAEDPSLGHWGVCKEQQSGHAVCDSG